MARDLRVTTHVALTARAFGASGFILADVEDKSIKAKVEKVVADWGGPFTFEMGVSCKKTVTEWKKNGGIVVHLTMYGQKIDDKDVMSQISSSQRDIMVVVGSQKVPGEFFSKSSLTTTSQSEHNRTLRWRHSQFFWIDC